MADPRHQKLAKVLVHYSLRLKPGDTFVISSSEIAAPLVREVYREALAAGAFVTVDIALNGIREILLRAGNDEQLAYISDIEKLGVDYYDVSLGIWAEQNTRAMSGVDPQRMALRRAARGPLMKRSLERMAKGETR